MAWFSWVGRGTTRRSQGWTIVAACVVAIMAGLGGDRSPEPVDLGDPRGCQFAVLLAGQLACDEAIVGALDTWISAELGTVHRSRTVDAASSWPDEQATRALSDLVLSPGDALERIVCPDESSPGICIIERARMSAGELKLLSVPISLASAGLEDLESLDGIGPKLAADIVAARALGAMKVTQLERIRGIGPRRITGWSSRLHDGVLAIRVALTFEVKSDRAT